ncbi:ATP dependent DNA ligase [Bradyrhizobium sp. URHC0002]
MDLSGRKPGRKSKSFRRANFPSSDSSRTPPASPPSTSARKRARTWSTWGRSGPGWSRTASSQIRKQLDTVVSPKSKLSKPIKKPKATWVEPTFVADIEYRDITSEGLLRASSFKSLSKRN